MPSKAEHTRCERVNEAVSATLFALLIGRENIAEYVDGTYIAACDLIDKVKDARQRARVRVGEVKAEARDVWCRIEGRALSTISSRVKDFVGLHHDHPFRKFEKEGRVWQETPSSRSQIFR